MRKLLSIAALWALFALPAQAALFDFNYVFGDGARGFALSSLPAVQQPAGFVNPGVLVGFNPQPDPPAAPLTVMSLDDPTKPTFANLFTGLNWRLHMSFLGVGMPELIGLSQPPQPELDGDGSVFHFGVGDHSFDVALTFAGPGGVNPASWVIFNPQPDPPGDAFGADFSFRGVPGAQALDLDPVMTFQVIEDGVPLAFVPAPVPEPETWSLLGCVVVILAALGVNRGVSQA